LNHKSQMKIRLLQRKFFGWHFLIGLLVFAAMTVVLAEISDQVMEGEPLTKLDAQLTNWLHLNRTAAQINFFKVITLLGSTVVATALTIFTGVWLLKKKAWYRFTALVLSVAGGAILNRTLKLVFQRARPQFDDPIMSFTGYSFPSGHTLTATVLYGCFAILIIMYTRDWRVRVATLMIAGVLILLVAFSRIYLGAHYLTDVVSAIAEGLAWLSLCFTFVYSFWRERNDQI
jgi:membrane-associated phospholipid phosphatase